MAANTQKVIARIFMDHKSTRIDGIYELFQDLTRPKSILITKNITTGTEIETKFYKELVDDTAGLETSWAAKATTLTYGNLIDVL